MSNDIKWYSLENILKYDVQYYIIFGERSNGKTYAVCEKLIDDFFEKGYEFGLIRRYEEDIKAKNMDTYIPLDLKKYMLEKYNHHVKFYRGKWYVYEDGLEGKISECTVFGHAFSVANANRTKSLSFPLIENLVFEEFMSMSCDYLPDEINLFLNLISTIVRFRHTPKIFMLANAISKYSPYSSALKLKLHRLKKGEIILREYKDEKGFKSTFAIERTENVNVFDNSDNTEKIVYNMFGNSGVGKMITSGDFEVHAYPRRVNGVTFDELKIDKNDSIIGKKHLTKFVIRYEDYYYRIYLFSRGTNVLGFREIEEDSISEYNTKFVINGINENPRIININNLAYYDNPVANDFINLIVACMRQKDFVTLSDDDGENVINGFRLSGINLI